MAELRHDPLTGRWVLLAPGRADRPHPPPGPGAGTATPGADRAVGGDGGAAAACPFCPGHEAETPPEVARRGPGGPDRPGWDVRVVPNRYPLVGDRDPDPDPDGDGDGDGDGLRRRRPAGGAHEVAVLSPAHDRPLGRLEDHQVHEVLLALRDRARAHAGAGHRSTQLLVNHGATAGASLAHPHAQIVAVDVTPPTLAQELAHLATGPDGCALCREEARQAHDAALVVVATEAALLWCPWWSSTAYELLLSPRRHLARFEDADAELAGVAATLRAGLARLDRALGDPAYNVVVHTRPTAERDDFHWHLHVRPRLQVDAGFELGTGIPVSTRDPAAAAAHLRGA